jgi:hypothetical protein
VTHPGLAKEADGWDPEQFTKGMNKVVDWKCKIEHLWFSWNDDLATLDSIFCFGNFHHKAFDETSRSSQ